MKYILLNDLSYFFKYKNKIIPVYLLLLLGYFLFSALVRVPFDQNLFYKTLTLNCDFKTEDWLNIILYFFSSSVYVYIALVLFTKDLKNELSNIFLRMKPSKWILYKGISIFIISLIVLVLAYLIIYIPFIAGKNFIKISIILFVKNLFYLLLLQHLTLLFFIIFSKMKKIIPVIILLILININFIPTNIINTNFIILILLFILVYLLLIKLYNYLFVNVFENI